MAVWQQPSLQNQRRNIVLSGGIYTGSDSFDIQDNQSINEYGWDTDENFPALSTAKANTAYGASGGAATRLLMNYANVQLIRAVGTKLQKDNSGTWSDIASGFSDTDWDGANFDVNGPALIITNGTDPVKYWNGTALQDLSANAPKGKYIAADNRRVYIAGVSGEEDVVHFCAFQDATDWTSQQNAGSVEYYTANGGPVTALYAFQGQIWAFKKDAFCLIYHTGDARFTHRLVEASDNIGCVNYKTISEVGNYLFWLGQKDIYMGSSGAASPIGEPVRTFINRINQAQISKCCAFTDGIRYYLCLPIDGATEPNYRLMFDPRYKIWRVAQINESFRFGVFFDGNAYAGDVNGQTWKIHDASTSGAWLIDTKDFDKSEAEKELWEAHAQMWVPSGTTVNFSVSVDQGQTWVPVGEPVTGSNVVQNKDIIIPLNTVPYGYWYRFRISGNGPFRLYSFQVYFNVLPVQI